MNTFKENFRYSLLFGCYMMIMCAGFSYVTYYLLDRQVSDSHIGILIAASCLLAIVIQQFLGRMVDSGRLDGKKALLFFTFGQSILGFAIIFLKSSLAAALLYGMIMCSIQIIQPILNSITFYYKNEGISVNYGIARGVGSLCYSGCSMLLGFLTVKLGSFSVPLLLGILSAVIFLIILSMPSLKHSGSAAPVSGSGRSFRLSRYPALILMLAGLALIMVFHNMIMTYFIYIVERAGGDSSHMGFAIGLGGLFEIPILFFYTKIKGSRSSRCFLAFSGAAFFAKSVLFIFARSTGMIYFVQSLQCLSYGLMAASRVYYVDETVGKENETTGQAYMAASETVGIVFGSSLGGFLMQAKGIDTLLSVGTAVCLAGMLLMLASLFPRSAQK